jgi:hypothetical protein
MEVSGQLYVLTTLPPGKEARYPLDRWSEHDVVKNTSPHRESNPDHSIFQPVASRYTD